MKSPPSREREEEQYMSCSNKESLVDGSEMCFIFSVIIPQSFVANEEINECISCLSESKKEWNVIKVWKQNSLNTSSTLLRYFSYNLEFNNGVSVSSSSMINAKRRWRKIDFKWSLSGITFFKCDSILIMEDCLMFDNNRPDSFLTISEICNDVFSWILFTNGSLWYRICRFLDIDESCIQSANCDFAINSLVSARISSSKTISEKLYNKGAMFWV